MNVNLSEPAVIALEFLEGQWHMNQTQVMDAALRRCGVLTHHAAARKAELCLRLPDGTIERVHLL